jgi:hypothetical protein
MYKINLDLVWNLLRGTVTLSNTDGEHCAIGKICAGIKGKPLEGKNYDSLPAKVEEKCRS